MTSTFNKSISTFIMRYWYSEDASVVPLKYVTITNAFQQFLGESSRKSNKIWVDKGSKFYNRTMKSWLQDNGIDMYSTHNEESLLLLKDSLEP